MVELKTISIAIVVALVIGQTVVDCVRTQSSLDIDDIRPVDDEDKYTHTYRRKKVNISNSSSHSPSYTSPDYTSSDYSSSTTASPRSNYAVNFRTRYIDRDLPKRDKEFSDELDKVFYEPTQKSGSRNGNLPISAVAAESALVHATYYATERTGRLAAKDIMERHFKDKRESRNYNDTSNLIVNENLLDIIEARTALRSYTNAEDVIENHMKRVYLLCKKYNDVGKSEFCNKHLKKILMIREEIRGKHFDLIYGWRYYYDDIKEGQSSGSSSSRYGSSRETAIEYDRLLDQVERLIDEAMPLEQSPPEQKERQLLEEFYNPKLIEDIKTVQRQTSRVDKISEKELDSVSMNQVYLYAELMMCKGFRFNRWSETSSCKSEGSSFRSTPTQGES